MSRSNHSRHEQEQEHEHEETNDPFLSIDAHAHADAHLRPQTLYQHEHHRPHHNHGQVNEEDIDPSLHQGRTQDQDPSRTRTPMNRLTDFASHILGSQDGHDHSPERPHEHDQHGHRHNEHGQHQHQHREHGFPIHQEPEHHHEHEHEHDTRGHLSFTGEGGILESSNHGFHAVGEVTREEGGGEVEVEQAVRMAAMEDEGEFEPHIESDHEDEGEDGGDFEREETAQAGDETQAGQVPGQAQGQGQAQGRVGRKRGPYTTSGRGRKRHAGDPVDATIIKKSNHKEVERKRRNNISEGIDLLVAQMGIPELEKAGKAVQLRRAVEYMAEMGERLGGVDKELEDLRREKQDLEANLALTSQRYTEEHERCTRYETLWRDAQDREAKGQFEIAQLLDEISQLRAKR